MLTDRIGEVRNEQRFGRWLAYRSERTADEDVRVAVFVGARPVPEVVAAPVPELFREPVNKLVGVHGRDPPGASCAWRAQRRSRSTSLRRHRSELLGSIEGGLPTTLRPVAEHLDAVPQVLERQCLNQVLELPGPKPVQVVVHWHIVS